MTITINLEIGHDASLRTKTTPEGFTHDWEVYVKGCSGAEIHYYVEKVVFHLHETFPKPKRVVKEPPYSLRTSGYAGFNLPIEIYLKNNQEPKKIKFNYDLQLQPRGPPIHNVQKEKYVFHSPSEEFRSRLLKGGGIIGSGNTQDISDRVIDEKNLMTSKPKLSGSDPPKKHKIKIDEPRNTDFLNLFGTPITKTSKVPEPPKPKEVPKSSSKLDKPVDKDKSKVKSPHKDKGKEKSKDKDKPPEGSEKRKEEKKESKKDKNKDRDRSKEKSSKKDKEKEKSPLSRPRSLSPKRSPKRPLSPPPQKHSSSKEKEQSKEERKDKDRKDEKKNKKEKREHKESKHKDRDKDKEHKEHKSRDSKSSKELPSGNLKEKEVSPTPAPVTAPPSGQKIERKEKSKESLKEPRDEEKSDKSRSEKSEDKQQRHKHKKKDRKEKREEKYSSKPEKKFEKPTVAAVPIKEETKEAPPVSSIRDADKSNLFGSPKSEPPSTLNQSESKEKLSNNLTFKDEDISNDSVVKVSSRESSLSARGPSKSPSEPSPDPPKQEVEKKKEESPKKKDKKDKKKDKKGDRDHEKRRKRKSPQAHTDVDQPPDKVLKEEQNNNSDDERVVSSTEDANLPDKHEAEDYMGMLRDLQHKIMGLKDNSDLQKVVQLIAETGRYEVSAHTFDFDLCLLDRSTVRQLQDFFASIS